MWWTLSRGFAVDIIEEIAKEKGLSFKMVVIESELDKEFVKKNLIEGR